MSQIVLSPNNAGTAQYTIAAPGTSTNRTLTLPDATATLATTQNITSSIQPISASVAANALTITLNPTNLDFRSTTLSSGTVVTRVVSSPVTLTISSGSTLGTVNNVASRIVVLAIDNAGTVELAAVNISGGNQLDETNLINTTAEGGTGAADSANVIYSTTARTSVAYRVVGFVDSTQTTAGTWATAPSTVQGVGGQALAALSSLGYGQTWQNVTGSRVSGTTYYNTTGKPIQVYISNSAANPTVSVGGVNINGTSAAVGAQTAFVVPPGVAYSYTGTFAAWSELR